VYKEGLEALPTMAVVLACPGFWLKDTVHGGTRIDAIWGEGEIYDGAPPGVVSPPSIRPRCRAATAVSATPRRPAEAAAGTRPADNALAAVDTRAGGRVPDAVSHGEISGRDHRSEAAVAVDERGHLVPDAHAADAAEEDCMRRVARGALDGTEKVGLRVLEIGEPLGRGGPGADGEALLVL